MKKKVRQTHTEAQSLKHLTSILPKSQGHESHRKTEKVSQIRGNTKVIQCLNMMGKSCIGSWKKKDPNEKN